jgi:hypothetical protein
MADELITIGCKLPSGITLEIGLQTTMKDGNGKQMTMVSRTENYRQINLKGWHAHTEHIRMRAREQGVDPMIPAGADMRPFLNRGIKKADWEEWKKTHKGSWLLKNEILFEAADEASAQLRVLESEKTPAPFAPLKPKKLKKGEEVQPGEIAVADFATRE